MTAQRPLPFLAIIFIATIAISTWAEAEIIYKCGSTYSSSPCPGGTLLTIDDARDPAQKQQADAATRRDTELAAAMEKERMAQERAAQLAPSSRIKKTKKATGKASTVPFKPRRVKAKSHPPAASDPQPAQTIPPGKKSSAPSASFKPGRQQAHRSPPTAAPR